MFSKTKSISSMWFNAAAAAAAEELQQLHPAGPIPGTPTPPPTTAAILYCAGDTGLSWGGGGRGGGPRGVCVCTGSVSSQTAICHPDLYPPSRPSTAAPHTGFLQGGGGPRWGRHKGQRGGQGEGDPHLTSLLPSQH